MFFIISLKYHSVVLRHKFWAIEYIFIFILIKRSLNVKGEYGEMIKKISIPNFINIPTK